MIDRSKMILLLCCVIWLQSGDAARSFAQYDLADGGFDGFLVPGDDVMVAALEAGRLGELFVKVGDRVEAGQALAQLDDSIQRVAVESAIAVAAMHGTLDAASADRALHELRLHQLRDLAAKGVARPEELSRAEAEFEVAEARWLSAKEERIVRDIDLKRAREQLRRRQIITPIAGVVAKIFCKPGEFVSPNDPVVVHIIDVQSLIGEFNIPAADALRFTAGQTVKVNAISLATAVSGVVESIAPLIDGESGTIGVKVRIDNAAGTLVPGDRCYIEPPPKAVRLSDRSDSREPRMNPLRPPAEATRR
jgi:RND family efflux transporter MFP subunit